MPSHACPTCKKKLEYASVSDLPDFPFCSDRCRLVDFGRWMDEGYVISQPISPADLVEEKGADESPAPPASVDENEDEDGSATR